MGQVFINLLNMEKGKTFMFLSYTGILDESATFPKEYSFLLKHQVMNDLEIQTNKNTSMAFFYIAVS